MASHSESTLQWQVTDRTERVGPIYNVRKPTNTDLSRALKAGGILDSRVVDLPGAQVLLPKGVAIMRRLGAAIREAFAELGYGEYDFPMLAPVDSYAPLDAIMPLSGKLLMVGIRDQLTDDEPKAVLGPSGEAVIYSTWSRWVSSPSDLPIRVLRQARYFRPMPSGKRSGRGLFRSMEAADVFETHACLDPDVARQELDKVSQAIRVLLHGARLPVVNVERPLWGNNSKISRETVGWDFISPLGGTIQVGSAYHQADILSRQFGISYRVAGQTHYPHHVTSAISRRIMLAHALLFLRDSGDLLFHPVFAAEQVRVVLPPEMHGQQELETTFAADGVRAQIEHRARPVETMRDARRQGTPLCIIVRASGAALRAILVRSDTGEEASVPISRLTEIAALAGIALSSISASLDDEVALFKQSKVLQIDSDQLDKAEEWTRGRGIVVVPLDRSSSAVTGLERKVAGEVLGFVRTATSARCAVTGVDTNWLAYASPRD